MMADFVKMPLAVSSMIRGVRMRNAPGEVEM